MGRIRPLLVSLVALVLSIAGGSALANKTPNLEKLVARPKHMPSSFTLARVDSLAERGDTEQYCDKKIKLLPRLTDSLQSSYVDRSSGEVVSLIASVFKPNQAKAYLDELERALKACPAKEQQARGQLGASLLQKSSSEKKLQMDQTVGMEAGFANSGKPIYLTSINLRKGDLIVTIVTLRSVRDFEYIGDLAVEIASRVRASS